MHLHPAATNAHLVLASLLLHFLVQAVILLIAATPAQSHARGRSHQHTGGCLQRRLPNSITGMLTALLLLFAAILAACQNNRMHLPGHENNGDAYE